MFCIKCYCLSNRSTLDSCRFSSWLLIPGFGFASYSYHVRYHGYHEERDGWMDGWTDWWMDVCVYVLWFKQESGQCFLPPNFVYYIFFFFVSFYNIISRHEALEFYSFDLLFHLQYFPCPCPFPSPSKLLTPPRSSQTQMEHMERIKFIDFVESVLNKHAFKALSLSKFAHFI